MPLLARSVESPLAVTISSGAIGRMGELLADGRISAGGRVAVVIGPGLGDEITEVIRPWQRDAEILRVSDCSVDGARELADRLRTSFFDAVVGIGGGRTLDIAKYAASLVGLPMVAVATSLANDGLASPVASLEQNGHKGSYGVHIPIAVVVDLDYVRRGSVSGIRAGVGDAVSNLSALADWRLADRARGESVDGLAAAFARAGAESVLHHPGALDSDDFLQTLAEALVLSGLAMAVAGTSRPCSGACHEISHAIDAHYPGRASHGDQVAVGALFATFLRGDDFLGSLDACLRRHGVPRLPADIGLSAEEFCTAVGTAPSTRPDRYTVLEDLGMDAEQIRKRVDEFIATFHR
ncbi:MAG: iron-containing alcohol dehydrogenase family protein [Thermocrispum sp.]